MEQIINNHRIVLRGSEVSFYDTDGNFRGSRSVPANNAVNAFKEICERMKVVLK